MPRKYTNVLLPKGIIKRTAKGILLASLCFSGVYTAKEVGTEVYENMTGQNEQVDLNFLFGDIILKSDEKRAPEQVLLDVQTALLESEVLKRAYTSNSKLTLTQKKEILSEVARIMAKEGNINPVEVNYFNALFNKNSQPDGYYRSLKVADALITYNKINVDENVVYDSFNTALRVVIHEMIHAIEYQNLYTSSQFTKFDREFLKKSGTGLNDYVSSSSEINAHLISTYMVDALKEKYSPGSNQYGKEHYPYKKVMLDEMIVQLYGIKTKYASVLDSNSEETLQKYYKDVYGYKQLTLEEIMLLSMAQKIEAYGLKAPENLKETYYFKSLENMFSKEIMNSKYSDFRNGNTNTISKVISVTGIDLEL